MFRTLALALGLALASADPVVLNQKSFESTVYGSGKSVFVRAAPPAGPTRRTQGLHARDAAAILPDRTRVCTTGPRRARVAHALRDD